MTIQFNREWKVKLVQDFTENSSNKLFTIPTLKEWIPQSIRIEANTTATLGNRQIEIIYLDDSSTLSGNKLAEAIAGVTQAPSSTIYYTYTLNGLDMVTARATNYISCVLPHVIMTAGMKIRVVDKNGIDESGVGENLLISLMVLERDKEL
jgi:hypothetical protein